MTTVIRLATSQTLSFWCPGCNEAHSIRYSGTRPCWSWNNDLVKPTFSPSSHIKTGHYCTHYNPETDSCWCMYYKDPQDYQCTICHSFVTDGKIQYLADSTHALAGQTVDLPKFPKI